MPKTIERIFTAEADVALAAKAKVSTRYNWLHRSKSGYTTLQCYAKLTRLSSEDTRPNNRHDPVERSLGGPTVPAEGSEDEEGPQQRNLTYKRPIGTKKDPKKRAGTRISGVDTPPFFSPSFRQPEKIQLLVLRLRTVEYSLTCL